MKKELKAIHEFHKAFGIEDGSHPRLIDEADYLLRYDLMKEENDEYLESCQGKDIIGIADALGDKLVILCGTILKHGLQDLIVPIFNSIHENNMTKLGLDGKPLINGENGVLDITRPLGKVLKPEHYKPVDLTKFFSNVESKS